MIPLWYTIFSSQSPFLFYTTCITPYHFLISLLIFFPMQFAVMVLYFWGILCFLQVYLLVKVQVLSCGLPQVEIKAKFESFLFLFFSSVPYGKSMDTIQTDCRIVMVPVQSIPLGPPAPQPPISITHCPTRCHRYYCHRPVVLPPTRR